PRASPTSRNTAWTGASRSRPPSSYPMMRRRHPASASPERDEVDERTESRIDVSDLCSSGGLGLYPPPCGEGRPPKRSEGGRGGGRAMTRDRRLTTTTPTPIPSPQGGGEHTACADRLSTYIRGATYDSTTAGY